MKLKFKKHEIEKLYYSPVMEILVEALKSIALTDAEELSRNISIKRPCEEVAMHIAEFRGRQQMLRTFTDPDLMIQFLDEFIITEDEDNG